MDDIVTIPLYLDLAAVFLGGLSGSLYSVRRGFSVTGLIAMAVAAGLGGGILRDVLLATRPVALTQPWYLPTVLVAAALGFFFGSVMKRFRKPIIVMDAVWLGLYAVVGAQKALVNGLSGFSAILLGAVTAVGGSVLVDVLAGEKPDLVQPGPIGHFGAVVGAVIYVVMAHWLDVSGLVAMIVTVVVVFIVRVAALRYGIPVPTALDIPKTITRVKSRPPTQRRRRRRVGARPGKSASAGTPTSPGDSEHDRPDS